MCGFYLQRGDCSPWDRPEAEWCRGQTRGPSPRSGRVDEPHGDPVCQNVYRVHGNRSLHSPQGLPPTSLKGTSWPERRAIGWGWAIASCDHVRQHRPGWDGRKIIFRWAHGPASPKIGLEILHLIVPPVLFIFLSLLCFPPVSIVTSCFGTFAICITSATVVLRACFFVSYVTIGRRVKFLDVTFVLAGISVPTRIDDKCHHSCGILWSMDSFMFFLLTYANHLYGIGFLFNCGHCRSTSLT